MCNFFSRLKQHFRKHPCCCVSLAFLLLLLLWLADLLLVQIITPFRCDMWKGKELEVFLTPEEWRKLSGVNESLKDTEWIHYPAIEGKAEKDPFFIKNKGVYHPVMYFNGDRHWLSEVNSKYPYLNIYIPKRY